MAAAYGQRAPLACAEWLSAATWRKTFSAQVGEVAALAAAGASVAGIDYAQAAVERTKERLAAASMHAQVVQADVLKWAPPQPVDAVYEQTCLCALHPDHWTAYAAQLHAWLRPGAALFALFMQLPKPELEQGFVTGPPYHCDINAMRALCPASRWEWPRPLYERVAHPKCSLAPQHDREFRRTVRSPPRGRQLRGQTNKHAS